MAQRAWRKRPLAEALADECLRDRLRAALAGGPVCDACLGRLLAQVDTGRTNPERGRAARAALAATEPTTPCRVCEGLFDRLDVWAARVADALATVEYATFLVASHTDPALEARERAVWEAAGDETSEPYKQAFNRDVGKRLCGLVAGEPEMTWPDVVALCDHTAGTVALELRPLFLAGRYRKLIRGLPQCRWRAWPTSVEQIVGEPVMEAAAGDGFVLHGCGREDTDVRCLGDGRPFVLEITHPRRRRLDWRAVEAAVARDPRVEVHEVRPTHPTAVAAVKALRPEKTYRALVHLASPMTEEAVARLAPLEGPIRQRTPVRVRHRRANRKRRRVVKRLDARLLGNRTLVLEVRGQAGLYIKELISGDGGRTQPNVAGLLGTAAECVELDVVGVHVDDDWAPAPDQLAIGYGSPAA